MNPISGPVRGHHSPEMGLHIVLTVYILISMVKKLTKMGNSLGIVIDKPILDLLKITPETQVEISTDGDRLIIQPLRRVDVDEGREIGRRVMKKHAAVLKKLAE